MRVQDVRKSKSKAKFEVVNNEFIKIPDDQSWFIYTNDSKVFKGTPFEFKGAIISHDEQGFHLSFCNNAIKFAPELNVDAKNGLNLDLIQKKMKREKERKESQMSRNNIFVNHKIEKDIQERERNREMERANGSDIDEIDFSEKFDDDDEAINNDNSESSGEVSELDEDIFNSDNISSDDEEEEKKEKKDKNKEIQRILSEDDKKTDTQIIEDTFGKPVVKPEEVIRLFKDVGMVTKQQLITQFKGRLSTNKQKTAFLDILRRYVRTKKIGDVTYYQLK